MRFPRSTGKKRVLSPLYREKHPDQNPALSPCSEVCDRCMFVIEAN
jgi:hypothetical protein